MLKFTKRPKTPGITLKKFKKRGFFFKEIGYLQVILMFFRMKYTLVWFKLQRNETGGDTFEKSFQLQISVLHQSLPGQNIKKRT